MAAPRPASCRYLGADAWLVTARGQLPVQAARVGDLVLAGDGGWAAVSHTRRVLHRGALVALELGGGGQVRATRAQPLAVGPGHFADADQLSVGQTILVPVLRLPAADAPQTTRGHLAWLETVRAAGRCRTFLRTPWGLFAAEPPVRPPEDARESAPTLAGRYRITPAGLVRLAPAPRRGKNAMTEALGRHRSALWSQAFPPPPALFHRLDGTPAGAGALVCEQSVACRRDGDRIEFGVGAARAPQPQALPRALPRRVSGYGIFSHAGWIYGLTLVGADTLISSGVVAAHFPQSPPRLDEADIWGG